MKRNTTLALILTLAVGAFLVTWDFTPHASSEARQKGESITPNVSTSAGYRSPGERHKIQVSDPALAQELLAQGSHAVADYGSYQFLEVSSKVADRLAQNSKVQLSDESNLVLLNAGAIDTTKPEVQKARKAVGSFSGNRMHLVQFAGPVRPEWYDALAKTGAQIVTYIPNNTYLVYGNAASIARVQSLAKNTSVAQWDGAYTSRLRLDPRVNAANDKETAAQDQNQKSAIRKAAAPKTSLFAIQLFKDKADNAATLELIDRLKLKDITNQWEVLNYLDIVVEVSTADVINQLAARPDVVSIAPYEIPHKMDERQDLIISGELAGSAPTVESYLAYLSGKGFTQAQFDTSNFSVNISDSGLDNGTQTPNHFALYRGGDSTVPANSRVIYNRLEGTPNAGSTIQGCDGHGTENSHIIMGYVPNGTLNGVNFNAAPHADAAGFHYGLGVAPFIKIGSSVIFDPETFTNPNEIDLESRAYRDGARISSNSWGSNSNAYTVDSQNYDTVVRDAQTAGAAVPNAGNQEYIVVFAAGNAGSGANTVGEPSTAKNVITAGASENVQAFGGADGCGIGDTGADSANDIISFSSRGPTSDGRKKPDLVAPGTHVSGGVFQASLTNGSGTGTAGACFSGNGVCGGVGSNFFPAGQQYYTASSGTSHSTPAIAGASALVRQYFINQGLAVPSPAMNKGILMNSARYLNGTGANDNLWSNSQGMGEVNMNTFYDTFATTHVFKDQGPAELFTASGQQRTVAGTVSTSAKPFRVTLAWTDKPGPTSGAAYVNNLDLEVTVGGNTYKGNVFTGANSATGGTADDKNNVESVFIPAGVSGSFIVKVKATNIAGDGVPGNANALDQDYALVIYNGAETPVPVISTNGSSITSESCAPANSAIDQGETVTVSLGLQNVGTANTTNLVATLLPTGGVSSPSGPQTYGALTAGGATVNKSFTFTNTATCGSTLTVTLQLQDGATDLGTVTFTFSVGTLSAGSVTSTYSSGNIATPIPDVNTVEIPFTVSEIGAVSDVNVRVRLNHTFDGDLVIEVVHPDGTAIALSNSRGGNGDNYGSGTNDCSGTPTVFDDSAATTIASATAPFVGTFKPDVPLAGLNGKPTAGTWKLRVTDTAADDTGTIGCATLEIARQQYICCGVAGTPSIQAAPPATVAAENYGPPNNAIDPGETVTVNFPLKNVGTAPTTNLVATLLPTGGVTNPSGPQNYGALPISGTPVSRPFTFTANVACGGTITATLQLQDGATNLGTVTFTLTTASVSGGATAYGPFTNSAAITVPATGTSGVSSPYPSNITVAGVPTTINAVTVTLNSLSHTFPDDIDVLLVSPTGRKMIIMSDAGTLNPVTNVTITLDDNAATAVPDAATLTTGSFKPGNYGTAQDPFASPAPAGPYLTPPSGGTDTLTSAFTGAAGGNPNGTWSLYVVDDGTGDTGSFAGGWTLNFSVNAPLVCAQQTMISEFRLRGPSGAQDEFVEILNNSNAPLTVNSTAGGSTGWAVVGSDGTARFTIPNGTVIPAQGHYLGVNNTTTTGYSLGSYPAGNGTTATGNATFTSDIPDNGGVALFNTTVAANYDAAHKIDSAGFAGAPALYVEGTGIPVLGTAVTSGEQYSMVRRVVGATGGNGSMVDSTNNAADFVAVSTTGTISSANVQLGAPGPENLSSPRTNGSITPSLVSPSVGNTVAPNRTQLTCANAQGAPCPADPAVSDGRFIAIRRRFTNGTGAPVTRLRFRIVDITTFHNPVAGQADLRAVTSSTTTVPDGSGIPGANVTVQGTTLETPPAQAIGGGLNSSMSTGAVSLATPLANGAAVDLQFMLGIKAGGAFRFFISLEALP